MFDPYIEKHPTSYPLSDVVQRPCLYRHPLEIQPDYVISRLHGNPCNNKKGCVKLGMMPTQTNVKITAAHIKYQVNRNLIFKCHKRFQEERESLKDDYHSGRSVNVKWHNMTESLMDVCINKDTVQHLTSFCGFYRSRSQENTSL